MNNKLLLEKIVIKSILFLGVVLSLAQYVYNRSLWLDESLLALNIINRSYLELLRPLDYIQVAPILFLQIEKLFAELIPNSEYGLRLFPLLSFWGSLFFFYKTIKVIYKNSYTIIFSLSLFVINSTVILYSSEVKQYMTDVLVLTSIYYFLTKNYEREIHKYYYLGIIGVVSLFLSNICPFILFTVGLYLLYFNKKKYFLSLTLISFLWIVTFLLYYLMFIHNHPSQNAQVAAFSSEGYYVFMPTNPFNIDLYIFFYKKGIDIFYHLFGYRVIGGIGLLALFIIGIVILVRKKRLDIIILTITPIILHLLLSSLKLYPFHMRLILYLCPIMVIIISFGFDYLINICFAGLKIERFRLLAVIIPLIMSYYVYSNTYPIQHEEIKRSISYIQQHINNDDKIYVYYGASCAYEYYSKIRYTNITTPIIYGKSYRKSNEKYLEEMKNLKGRNWLLFSHVYDNEETCIIKKLDSLGYKRLDSFFTIGSSTYLYDFGQ